VAQRELDVGDGGGDDLAAALRRGVAQRVAGLPAQEVEALEGERGEEPGPVLEVVGRRLVRDTAPASDRPQARACGTGLRDLDLRGPQQLLTQIDAREIDIAVIVRPRLGLPADLKWIPLLQEPFVVIRPADAPLALHALPDAMPFIRYNRRSQGGQMVDRYLKQHRLWVRDGMELDEPLVIMNMVGEGLGWSIIPGDLIPLATTPNVKVLPLPGRALLREMGVLVRTTALKRPSTAALIDSLSAEMENFNQRTRPVAHERTSWK
jgi:DNA-binding transcriptional LysR family regulator